MYPQLSKLQCTRVLFSNGERYHALRDLAPCSGGGSPPAEGRDGVARAAGRAAAHHALEAAASGNGRIFDVVFTFKKIIYGFWPQK